MISEEEKIKKERKKERKKEYQKQYYLANKDKIVEQVKQYCLDNKEKVAKRKKQYRLVNKEKLAEKSKEYRKDNKDLLERKKQYYRNNKDKTLEQKKQYYLDNRDKIREYKKKYEKVRIKIDPEYRLRKIVSTTIAQALKRNGSSKAGESCLKHLPYTIEELREHLEKQFEPWMNWDNHGKADSNNQTWQIDHKEAQSKFHYKTMRDSDFIKCWGLSNLQPLESFANLKKSNK